MPGIKDEYGRVNVSRLAMQTADPNRLRKLLIRAENYVADAKRFMPEWPALAASFEADVVRVRARLKSVREKR